MYYYNQLPKHHQKVYHAMLTGLQEISPRFSVPRLEGRELAEIYFKIRLDHPEIFYTVSFKWQFAQHAEHVEILPEYLFPKAKIEEHRKALTARVQKLARPAQNMSEWEKEAYIHDFIVQNVRYDKLKKPYSHEIIGPLQNGVGVCEGIAKTVKLLCDRLGIECLIAISDKNPDSTSDYLHAWNIVKLDGGYYNVDVSRADTKTSPERYFNRTDEDLRGTHKRSGYSTILPKCRAKTYEGMED